MNASPVQGCELRVKIHTVDIYRVLDIWVLIWVMNSLVYRQCTGVSVLAWHLLIVLIVAVCDVLWLIELLEQLKLCVVLTTP